MIADDGDYLKMLISRGENTNLDFKFKISDSRKIARTVSAYANTEGGVLLLGVKDNGVISGVRSEEELYMVETAVTLYCRPEVNLKWRNLYVADKTVVEVAIKEDANKPVYAKDIDNTWVAYYRVNDQNIVLPEVILKIWQRKRRETGVMIKYSKLQKWLMSYLLNKQVITLAEFAILTGISKSEAEDCLADLHILGVLKFECTADEVYFMLNEN